jgi:hypothetical protein
MIMVDGINNGLIKLFLSNITSRPVNLLLLQGISAQLLKELRLFLIDRISRFKAYALPFHPYKIMLQKPPLRSPNLYRTVI